jgi:cyclic pyranopterin phosphate synthase
MARLTLTYPFHIRFIEYMPIGTDPVQSRNYFLSASEIRERIEQTAPLLPVSRTAIDGPAMRFRFAGAPGEIGLITAMSAHFCDTCNRLRLTAKGQLRPCLLSDETVDILTPLRENATDAELAACFSQAIWRKQNKHHMNFTRDRMLQTKMVSIGG